MKKQDLKPFLCLLPFLAHMAAFAQENNELEFGLKLAQGTSTQLKSKPAELFYQKENGEGSSAVNAGLTGSVSNIIQFLGYQAPYNPELLLGASIAKNNVRSKPQDVRAVDIGVRNLWNLSGDRPPAPDGRNKSSVILEGYLSYSKEEDRIKRAKGHKEQLDGSLTGLCESSNGENGDWVIEVNCYPYIGVYRRTVSETDDPANAPLGRHGGPYAGFFLNLAFGKIDDLRWWVPFGVEAAAYHLRESMTSGGYSDKSYKYASLTFSYALYRGKTSKWKPKISLIREVGTDRLNNEDHIVSTKLALQVSYGL